MAGENYQGKEQHEVTGTHINYYQYLTGSEPFSIITQSSKQSCQIGMKENCVIAHYQMDKQTKFSGHYPQRIPQVELTLG